MIGLRVLIITVSIGFISACFSNEHQMLVTYREKISKAEQAELRGDYQLAEIGYAEAVSIADSGKWVDGMVSARRNLALMKTINGRPWEAENLLVEAWQLCLNESSCQGLDALCSQIVRHFVMSKKQPDEAEKYIRELGQRSERIELPETLKRRLTEYAEIMKENGFQDQSKALSDWANGL